MFIFAFPLAHWTPSVFSFITADTISVNGSSATGHCSSIEDNRERTNCLDPASSVLFDGVIPTLTGLDGDMWANQLLTLHSNSTTSIVFSFKNVGIPVVRRVKMVLFICEEWGISVESIKLVLPSDSFGTIPTITSCDSLVRVCFEVIPFRAEEEFSLVFDTNDWLHVAEVMFDSAGTCQKDAIITTPTNMPAPGKCTELLSSFKM